MADTVYSVKITFESIFIKDTGDGKSKGDVYFKAEVGGKKVGSPQFTTPPNSTIDLKGKGFEWEFRVLGSPGNIAIKVECWDYDLLSADDPLGSLSTSVGAPWKPTDEKRTATGGNFDLNFTVGVTMITLTKNNFAMVSRQHDGSTFKSTLSAPNVAVATLTEIVGLNKPGHDDRVAPAANTTRGSGYLKGYLSEDDKGRIFKNRLPDGSWKKDTQYIELTAVVEPSTVKLPAGAKMVWSFEDPDDPTNEGPNVHPDAGKLIDPNDYTAGVKTAAKEGDNNPSGKGKATPKFEEIDPKYALSGAETLIDLPTRTTKVRFHVGDIAGDNYTVKAVVKADKTIDLAVPVKTGIMTVWNRIDLEYVKMNSATELPVNDIATHYDMACAQVDVSLKRVVSGASDLPAMGADDTTAGGMCDSYATKAGGEFSMEGTPGWFFIVAANKFMPGGKAKVLYEGDAEARGNVVRLPAGTTLSKAPAVVRVFDPVKSAGMAKPKPNDHSIHFKFSIWKKSGRNLHINTHDFHLPEDPNTSFLDADLSTYGFAMGAKISVQIMSEGEDALVTAGISPGGVDIGPNHFFGGRLLVFTQVSDPAGYLTTLCHELCHAFDNAHKCGNFNWIKQVPRTGCCMNYWFQFILDDAAPRAAIPWTQGLDVPSLCAPHIRRMRDYHLQDNPGLGW